MTDQEKHLLHYLILLIGLGIFLLVFVFFWYNKEIQLLVGGVACAYYAAWGLVHHAVENRLTKIIATEYVLMAIFVFTILFTALKI